jgi:asparagine synthetase A
MEKVINDHIDSLEELEQELEVIIDNAIDDIDIEALVKDPTAELERVKEEIKEVFLSEYAPQAVELGFDFAKAIQERIDKDKPVKIQDSNNPELNDKDRDKK